jgi:ribosome maturation factor RimP
MEARIIKKKRGIAMAKKEDYEAKTERLLEPLMMENNFELVDVEYVKEGGNWYLRAYIDKEGGITVDDCELVSRALSDLLDANDFIDDAYILEVSSPGLGRQLKKDKDFNRSIGEEIDIKLYKAIDKRKEISGILLEFDKDTITIELEDGNTQTINRSDIAMVRLAFDF